MIAALANVTREGSLYRVDLRLRPDGQKGPIVSSAHSFPAYLKERAAIWEWLAYVKLRAVAGGRDFGARTEAEARHCIHELASRTEVAECCSQKLIASARGWRKRRRPVARRASISSMARAACSTFILPCGTCSCATTCPMMKQIERRSGCWRGCVAQVRLRKRISERCATVTGCCVRSYHETRLVVGHRDAAR